MRLSAVSRTEHGDSIRLTGTVLRDGQPPFELYLEFDQAFAPFVRESADPFAAMLLVPAMYWREELIIDPPISPRLAAALPEIRSIFAAWYPRMLRSAIDVTSGPVMAPSGTHAATFFSGGIDSFYTLLKRRGPEPLEQPLDYLIFMRGVETPLEESEGVESSLAQVMAVADQHGMTCITGSTNARTFFPWHYENYFVGSVLSATSLALGNGLRSVCIPSSSGYHNLKPGGSSALTDPLYSTEYTRIIYDGAEASRNEKTAAILRWTAGDALPFIRVCSRNHGGAFNCGTCHKCVRTMIALTTLGVRDLDRYFASTDRSTWPAALMADHFDYLTEHLRFAVDRDTDPALMRMVQRTIDRRERSAALHAFVKHAPPFRAVLPLFRKVRAAMGGEGRDHIK